MKKKKYVTPLTELIQTCHETLMQQTSWYDGEKHHHIKEEDPDEEDYYAKSFHSFNAWDEE